MAQQISHKKSLRLNRLNRDRRQLLKEYYQLEQQASAEDKEQPQEQGKLPEDGESKSETVQGTATDDKPIRECEFTELVRLHNKLLKKEAETNNSIKSTIYENYYDLIKVNDLLKEMSSANQPLLDRLKETVELLQS